MEIINVRKYDVDKIAKQVFDEAINLLGGLRKIMEYKNLTWLPSLAEASYVIVLKNESLLTSREIAEELGLSIQAVNNILRAEEINEVNINELKEVSSHKAGSIVKLAYKRIKMRK